jgi:hypothetical protein
MRSKLSVSLTTLVLGLIILACNAAIAQAYTEPTWSVGESEVTKSTAVHSASEGQLTFEDTHAYAASCKIATEGTVGTEGKGEITHASATECKGTKGCVGTVTAKAVHLPWDTRLDEIEEKASELISSSGAGQPGWAFECTAFKIKDECIGEITAGIKDVSGGVNVVFGSGSEHANCSIGGEKSGSVAGTEIEEAPGGKLIARAEDEDECGSGICGTNNITVNHRNLFFIGAHTGSEVLHYRNKNWLDTWRPAFHVVTPVGGTPTVWSFRDECVSFAIPARGECEVEVTYTGNGEPGLFIAEFSLDGAPTTANVGLFGME